MTSIRQIAHLTGYSPATVSRVLKHDPTLAVKTATRQTILQVAQQLGYQAQYSARVTPMIIKQSQILVLQTAQDPALSYFSTINAGIKAEAASHQLKIGRWQTIPDQPFASQQAGQYQGVILIGAFSSQLLKSIYQFNHRLVIVDDYRYFSKYDLVRNNYEMATATVLDDLYQRGHRRIAFIGGSAFPMQVDGSRESRQADIRTRSYESWMQAHHLAAHTYETSWTSQDGARAMAEILQSKLRVDAVLTASDVLASGVYRTSRQRGLKIPDDLAVASFDDGKQALQLHPTLSSVRPHSFEMGRTAVRLILERLTDHRTIPAQVILPADFIKRHSI